MAQERTDARSSRTRSDQPEADEPVIQRPLYPDQPAEIPAWQRRLPAWLRPLVRAVIKMIGHDGLELAGHMSFTAFTALFPFLIFLAALAGFLGTPAAADEVVDLMFRFMPDDVASTLAPAVKEVLSSRSGGLLTTSILLTLWFASGGVETLRLSLDRAYAVKEPWPIWLNRLQSLAIVIVGAFLFFIIALSIVLGPIVWQILDAFLPLGGGERAAWTLGRYALAIGLLSGGLTALHYLLPRHDWPFGAIFPGVLLTVALWIVGASLFSLYLGTVADYSVYYGSLGGVVITLMFFYITAVLFILGAEFNAAIYEERTRRRLRRAEQLEEEQPSGA